ncbi:MAG: hypothetical protein J2P53_16010 [Bradyrhizobiaceae bacterium]|nr:hypothetical protein [Bradyrhizobiaceae bacterium]
MRAAVAWVAGIVCGINGLAMILAPLDWYGALPGVADTGPFNPHFIRDIGCAYLLAGVALGVAGHGIVRHAAIPAAAFLVLHAFVHLADFAAGREDFHHLLGDLPGVFVLPVVAVWIAWSKPLRKGGKLHARDG